MGKKKIITKEGEATTTEQSRLSVDESRGEASVNPAKKTSSKKQVLNGAAVINVSYNNILISISDAKGQVISWSSSGLLGFRGNKKSTPYAANMVARDAVEKARKYNLANIKITVKGVGPGRESAIRGLAGTGLNILSIMDSTPIAHNGTRQRKPRRV
ncbi:MAG TPA: 30S ribosomal protein S11 [Candidatus Paceibacterota bacterium]|nr:30S ribosomal protein S11 [Candidatus Paceibacterota bacterium]